MFAYNRPFANSELPTLLYTIYLLYSLPYSFLGPDLLSFVNVGKVYA